MSTTYDRHESQRRSEKLHHPKCLRPRSESVGNQTTEPSERLSTPAGYPIEVYVEGTVGAGKSTLLEGIKMLLKGTADVFPEPVHDWENVLVRFYKDPASTALALQLRVLTSFFGRGDDSEAQIKIFERSPLATRNVFGEMLLEDDLMHPDDAITFNRIYENSFRWKQRFQFCIFVHVDVEESMRRVEKRSRKDDADIKEEYLMRLHKQYMKFVVIRDLETLRSTGMTWAVSPHFKKVIAIDGTRPKEEIARLAVKAINMFLQ